MHEIMTDISLRSIRPEILKLIREDRPEAGEDFRISRKEYEEYRVKYIARMIEEERGSLDVMEKSVLESIERGELLSRSLAGEPEEKIPLGDRLADKVAKFGGSWNFIGSFFLFMTLYILLNAGLFLLYPFDPYPFILLNLMLSCIAAIQAPIIMMSQNRQEDKDRIRAEHDYKINLKSEIEIRTLHEKVDHLLLQQWSEMMEVQDLQLELLQEIRERLPLDSGNV